MNPEADFGGDDDGSSAEEEEWGGDDGQAGVSTVLAVAGSQAEAAEAAAEAKGGPPPPAPAPTTELARQESAEAGRALFVRAVSGDEESESKGEGAAGAAAGGSSAEPRKAAPVDERELLRGIYEALGGPEHWRTKWDLDQPINTLHGVTCDGEQGPVIYIDLSLNGLEGDLSKVQWPDGLQRLHLYGTNVSGDLSKVLWPAALKELDLQCQQITGDLSKVQWPAALEYLNLSNCEKIEGDLSKVQWPAALETLDLKGCPNIEAPPGCPKYRMQYRTGPMTSDRDFFYYDSKEDCDELRSWIASQ